MSQLPDRPPPGTPVSTRRMFQPQDEVPETYLKDGKIVSPNPTEPKQRAEFAIEERILLTFDPRPVIESAVTSREKRDLPAFIKCFENSVMDIKVIGSHVYVTINPGGEK